MNSTTWGKLPAACCAAMLVLGAAATARAECAFTDWLFGTSRTTYAPPYTPPTVYAPAAGACGCAPAPQYAPACQTCAPAATYRISYRPVPTVAYAPVTSLDPSSGCAITTYQPTRVWTYYGSLVPYTAGYAPAYSPYAGCSTGGCSTCGAAPCSSCGGCSACGGCSSCSAGVSGGYVGSAPVASGGCSTCGAGVSSGVITSPLPGPGPMSRPSTPMTYPGTPAPATIGAPSAAPSGTAPPTYAPGSGTAPIAPSAPGASGSPTPAPTNPATDNRNFRAPASDASHTIDAPRIQGVPPMNGPQFPPAPVPRAESQDRVTSRPVMQAGYFQLLGAPPATVPAQTVSGTPAKSPVTDGGWQHYDP